MVFAWRRSLYIIEALLIQARTAYLYRIDIKLQGRVKSGAKVALLNLAGRGTSSNSSFRALRVSMEDGRVLGSGNSTPHHGGGDGGDGGPLHTAR